MKVDYSTINYKDALAITNTSPDRAQVADGRRASTARARSRRARHPLLKPGDRVILTGWGVGETHWGCLAQKARAEGRLAGAAARRA